ncbi:PSP1 C-terminal conserved region [Singulisphaera sp. GP187]|uniref:PSP1 family protein n=1 Tax=Singulisphaera sp. GP187 TaxID=1882752 RepID=UPI000926E9E7|nr:PSP1 domain-containing protein [Singulisphaera sp. GP187]SIO59009.1 PSP1 C-terminal conserved region [Singulisphaera sp. GP187]
MAHMYLIRYGLMARVGRFSADSADFERGMTVVIRSHRGTELGEVLAPLSSAPGEEETPTRVLRIAGSDDLEQARQAESTRPSRFEICQRLFQDGVWPMELIDVEPLLDDRRTVLHYLGPHRLDVTGLLSAFRSTYDLDVMLEPVGRDVPDEEVAEDNVEAGGCGSCGSDGGGCGSAGGGCGTGGCSDCGVKKLIAGSRRHAAR